MTLFVDATSLALYVDGTVLRLYGAGTMNHHEALDYKGSLLHQTQKGHLLALI